MSGNGRTRTTRRGKRGDTYPRRQAMAGIIGYRWPPRCEPRCPSRLAGRALGAVVSLRDAMGCGPRLERCRARNQGARHGWGGTEKRVGRVGWVEEEVHKSPSPQVPAVRTRPTRAAAGVASKNRPLPFDKNINLKHGAKLAILFPISRFVGWMAHVAATQRRPQPSEAMLRRSRRLRRPSRDGTQRRVRTLALGGPRL